MKSLIFKLRGLIGKIKNNSILRIGNYRFFLSYAKKYQNITDTIELVDNNNTASISYNEKILLCEITKMVQSIDGNIAEVGVYKGGSAKLISGFKGNKKLYLFDTFDGIPFVDNIDKDSGLQQRIYKSTLDEVKYNLIWEDNVKFFKGIFPYSANKIKSMFCFVHLDVDTYLSTKDSLIFFYPKLSKGGVILSHDFVIKGVITAFNDFFDDKKENPFIVSGNQIMVIKQ